jgi:hypothetical protein
MTKSPLSFSSRGEREGEARRALLAEGAIPFMTGQAASPGNCLLDFYDFVGPFTTGSLEGDFVAN